MSETPPNAGTGADDAGGARAATARGIGASWLRKPANAIGFGLFALVVAAGLLAPLIAPYDPGFIAIRDRLEPPSLTGGHLLGTDHLGRDIFSRMLYGARVSVIVGASVVVLSSLIGIAIGLFGGYSRRFGNFLMRIIDGVMAFPEIVFALALIAALGSSLTNVIIALTFVYVPRVARVVHACTLALRNQEFVLAAEALGGGTLRVAVRHILPNTLGPVVVQGTFIFAYAVISEASLTFLGVGLPPGTASWGVILAEGRNYLLDAPWITTFPGLAIFLLVLNLNILGDGLRDLLDPRSRKLL
ncbi:ABC transporter permease [Rhodobacteraceae bacterium CCMM004]|nr:ABC transporter permease [Rhodobacteraceae bacterium CCMM004]